MRKIAQSGQAGFELVEAMVAVARNGGFRVAARDLDMSSSALSHAVAALESRLGVRLFNHYAQRRTCPSRASSSWPKSPLPWLQFETAMERIDEHRAEPAGILALGSARTRHPARMILSPSESSNMMRRYPQVSVDMVTEAAMVDIVGQGFDAGVRLQEFVQF